MCAIFDFWWNNFLMGMKSNFKFEIWEIFYKGFPWKKYFPWEFLVLWTKIKIKGNSFVFFQAGQKKIIVWEFFVKWTHIKFKRNSLAFFSSSLEKYNCMQIRCKINHIKFRRNFLIFFQGGQKRKIMGILFEFFLKWTQIKLEGNSLVFFFSRRSY